MTVCNKDVTLYKLTAYDAYDLNLKGSASNNDVMTTDLQKNWAYLCMVQVKGVP